MIIFRLAKDGISRCFRCRRPADQLDDSAHGWPVLFSCIACDRPICWEKPAHLAQRAALPDVGGLGGTTP